MTRKLQSNSEGNRNSIFGLYQKCKKPSLNKLLFLVLGSLLFNQLNVSAQVANYTFSQSTTTYTSIRGATGATDYTGTGYTWDDNTYLNQSIGFSFVLNGNTYTTFSINANGYITLGGTASLSYTPISSGTAGPNVIAAFGRDLQGVANNNDPLAAGNISSLSSGGVLTVEWSNARRYNGAAGETFNFQIKLIQSTNSVQIVYGAFSNPISASNSSQPQVGLRGINNTDYNNRAITFTGSAPGTPDQTWEATISGTSNAATAYYNQAAPTVKPSTGLTFTWAPPAPCSGTPNAGTTVATPASRCGSGTFTLSITNGTLGQPGLVYQWQESTDGGQTYTDVLTGGNSVTYTTPVITSSTYYRLKVTCASTSDVSTSVPVQAVILPTPTVSASITGGTNCTYFELTASGTNNYTWSPVNGLNSTTGAVVSATPATATNYTVTGRDAQGCSATAVVNVPAVSPTANVIASASPASICNGGTTTLSAFAGNTLSYVAVPISDSAPVVPSGSVVTFTSASSPTNSSGLDDGYFAIPLPFTFSFYGNSYASAFIGINGYLNFGTSSTAYTPATIPSTNQPNNVIMGAMSDLHLGQGNGSISYFTEGTAPNRMFVVEFTNVAVRSQSASVSFQIILNENGNTIDIISTNITGTGSRSQGIENATGSAGLPTITARNNRNWTVTSTDGYRFLPAGGTFTYTWSGPNLSCTNCANPQATGLTQNTTYTVMANDAGNCPAGPATVMVVVGSPLTITSAISDSAICAGQQTLLSVEGMGGGLPYTYSWSGPNGFVAYTQNVPLTNAATSRTGFYTVTVKDACGDSLLAVQHLSVYEIPVASISTSNGNFASCSNEGFELLAFSSIEGVDYQWRRSGAVIAGADSSVYAPVMSGNYSVMVSKNGCSSTSGAVTVTIQLAPATPVISSSRDTACSGQPVVLSLPPVPTTSSAVIGNGTTNNQIGAYPAPYGQSYGGVKQQMLILASELSASGLYAGTRIKTVSFDVAGQNSGPALRNFNLKMKLTSLSELPADSMQTGLTQVLEDRTHQPIAGINTHLLDNIFVWDGTSNLIVEVCFNNNDFGVSTTNHVQTRLTETSFVSTTVFKSDNNPNVCSSLLVTEAFSRRPNMFLGVDSITYTWSPAEGLNATTGATVTATISANTTYTVVATTDNGCSSTGSITVPVNPAPVASIADLGTYCITDNAVAVALTGAPAGGTFSGPGVNGTTFNPAAAGAGIHLLMYEVTNSYGCSSQATDTVTVYDVPQVTVSAVPVQGGSGMQLNAQATGTGPFTYSWSPSTGLSATTIANPIANPSVSTTYTATVIGTGGCSSQATYTVTVSGLAAQIGKGLQLQLSPNPTTGPFTAVVASGAAQKATFTLTDLVGKVLQVQPVMLVAGQNNVLLNVPAQHAAGVYVVTMQVDNHILRARVVKQ